MNKVDDENIINDICDYAKLHRVKDVLQEYLRRVIVEQPEDPITFLIQTIRDSPCGLTNVQPEEEIDD